MKKKIILTVLVFCVMGDVWVKAGTVTLNFANLPSSQGWAYGGTDLESQFFSVNNNVLHQDTITNNSTGVPGAGGGGYSYAGSELIADGLFDIQLRVRVTAYSMYDYGPGIYNGAGFAVEYVSPNCAAILYISDTCCQAGTNNPAFYTGDNTGYHDYRMTDNLNGTYTVYRDSIAVGILPIIYEVTGYSMPHLLLGDATGGANAIADIAAFSYTTIPEPATVLLLAVGGTMLRKRAKSKR